MRFPFLLLGSLLVSQAFASPLDVRFRSRIDGRGLAIHRLELEKDGRLLLATDSEIVQWDGRHFQSAFDLKGTRVLFRDDADRIWWSDETNCGHGERCFSVIHPGGFNRRVSPGTDIGRNLIQTRDGSVWSLGGSAIFRFQGDSLKDTYDENNTPEIAAIDGAAMSASMDSSGSLWIATTNGVLKIDPERQFTAYPETDWTGDVKQGPDRRIWCLGSRGLMLLGDEGWQRIAPADPTGNLAFDPMGNPILIGHRRIAVWNGSRLDTIADTLDGSGIHPVVTDRTGRVYVGTARGLMVRDPASGIWTTYPLFEDGYLGRSVWRLFEDAQERVWIGTEEGVSYQDASGWHHFRIGSLVVYGDIESDLDGSVLVTSEKGLFKFVSDTFQLLDSLARGAIARSPTGEIVTNSRSSGELRRRANGVSRSEMLVDSLTFPGPSGNAGRILSVFPSFSPTGVLTVGGTLSSPLSPVGVSRDGLFQQDEAGRWRRVFTGRPNTYYAEPGYDSTGAMWLLTHDLGIARFPDTTSVSSRHPDHGILWNPSKRPFFLDDAGVFALDAAHRPVGIPGWDSASLRARNVDVRQLGVAIPAQAGGMWVLGNGNAWQLGGGSVGILGSAPWDVALGLGVGKVAPAIKRPSIELSRTASGTTAVFEGTEDAVEMVLAGLDGRIFQRSIVVPGTRLDLAPNCGMATLQARRNGKVVASVLVLGR